ncbi:hypothetical protein L5M51_14180 [Shewanella sp. SM73]|uniref:hypothetical protein n=1 Tax=Shewanella TaxID=22 RepID=UPI0021D99A69|nr:hypothetical protein [Shewanella sp. SM73]MCU8030897.1 hypothetical protein [Shewanella sp. SM73]
MTPQTEQMASSIGAWLELLPSAIAALFSLSALGYFVGWREANSYYTALGAAWAAASVSPLALLQLSASTIVTVAAAAFFSLILVLDHKVSLRKLSWFCAACLGIAGILLAASQGLFGYAPPSGAHILASVGSQFFAISAGVTLSELIGHIRQSSQPISSGHLWLIYWFVLPGLFWAPDRLGEARAIRDAEPLSSPLPVVELDSSLQPSDWLLVQLVGDKAILMMLADEAHNRRFRMVEVQDVKAFGSTLKPPVAKK